MISSVPPPLLYALPDSAEERAELQPINIAMAEEITQFHRIINRADCSSYIVTAHSTRFWDGQIAIANQLSTNAFDWNAFIRPLVFSPIISVHWLNEIGEWACPGNDMDLFLIDVANSYNSKWLIVTRAFLIRRVVHSLSHATFGWMHKTHEQAHMDEYPGYKSTRSLITLPELRDRRDRFSYDVSNIAAFLERKQGKDVQNLVGQYVSSHITPLNPVKARDLPTCIVCRTAGGGMKCILHESREEDEDYAMEDDVGTPEPSAYAYTLPAPVFPPYSANVPTRRITRSMTRAAHTSSNQ